MGEGAIFFLGGGNSSLRFLNGIAVIKNINFSAGVDTSMLIWILYYMAKYTEMQERVHREIDSVIGEFLQSMYC